MTLHKNKKQRQGYSPNKKKKQQRVDREKELPFFFLHHTSQSNAGHGGHSCLSSASAGLLSGLGQGMNGHEWDKVTREVKCLRVCLHARLLKL